MRRIIGGVALAALLTAPRVFAEPATATAAVAAGMKFAMGEIAEAYRRAHPQDVLAIVYGATGRLQAQIQQGAPFDLFFSADDTTPERLAQAGFAGSTMSIYAIGHLAIWSTGADAAQLTLASLAEPRFARVAIANPKVAPYGKRAEEALRAAQVWDRVKPRLVFGESVAQAAQFVASGNAQVGVIALSVALDPTLRQRGAYVLVPDHLHQPLAQGFIVTRRGAGNPVAKRFAQFMGTPAARAILLRYGYSLPGAGGSAVIVARSRT
jgi:molybdate transport system substrate-binding protein